MGILNLYILFLMEIFQSVNIIIKQGFLFGLVFTSQWYYIKVNEVFSFSFLLLR